VQSISGYLYDQIIDLVLFLDSAPDRENTLVYAKPLQIYKGIDNKIKLLIKNQDQKLQTILNSNIVFNLIDSANSELVFSRACVITPGVNGAASFVLNEFDLYDIQAGVYNYSIKLINGEGDTSIVFADDNYNAQGQARVSNSAYPMFKESIQVNLGPFYNNPINGKFGYSNSNIVVSDVVTVLDRTKVRAVLQTVQYYGTNFRGTVEIQGCLESTLTSYPNSWFTVDTQTFTNFTGVDFNNFVGKFSLVRFKVTTTSGSLNKILYRP
jgi:hypothetical protein